MQITFRLLQLEYYTENGMGVQADNSMCTYNTGCTSENALNPSTTATIDDGSCIFSSASPETEVNGIQANDISTNCGVSLSSLYPYGISLGSDSITLGQINSAITDLTGQPCWTNEDSYVPEGVTYAEVCTDPNATNSISEVLLQNLIEDGNLIVEANQTCTYPSGCSDTNALNFDSNAGFGRWVMCFCISKPKYYCRWVASTKDC